MKNFTLAVITATFVATGAFAQTSADKNILPIETKVLLEKFEKNMHAVKTMPATTKTMRAKRANEAAIWKPQHDIQYSYDEGWDKDAENNYTYNTQGLVLTQVLYQNCVYAKLENTYNSKGQITHQIISNSLDGKTYETNSERVLEYDEQTGYTTKDETKVSDGEGGTMISDGSNYTTIERNSDGNITKLTKYTTNYSLYPESYNEYHESERMEIEYANGGNAPTSITCYGYQKDGISYGLTETYTDMTWTKSDGQLTSANPLALISKTNQLKSCTIPGDEITLKFNVVDAKDNGAFTIRVNYEYDGQPVPGEYKYAEEKLEFTDDNGSYQYGVYIYYYNQVALANYIKEKFDAHGNSIRQEKWEEDWISENSKGAVLDAGIKHQYKYDGPHGEMTEDIKLDYNSNKNTYLRNMKMTYDSFFDANVTAIKCVNDNTNEPATFYNLQGMKVNDNAKGLYIMKQGSKIVKIMK
ncbi:hypothetical protein [uncultured Prevotella sp.]|uniref:hypothetical protein n=1 Tax=uncultured Prevotella sp. TaxID=159272 RepID=UPI0027E30706|nr:hypothetical protein [uncultured Prevotella sp.]